MLIIITNFNNPLTSLTNQLTGDLRKRNADTTFFHQFHRCSLPDDHKDVDKHGDKMSRHTWPLRRDAVLPRWSPETVNLFGLCPVHRPTYPANVVPWYAT